MLKCKKIKDKKGKIFKMEKTNEELKFVFDLDGTLIDKNQKLFSGVVKMFDEMLAKAPNASFTIASGSRLNQIEKITAEINQKLKNGKIDFNIISNAGSIVKRADGYMYRMPIKESDMKDVMRAVKESDDKAIMIFRTDEKDLMYLPKSLMEKGKHKLIDVIGKKYWLTPEYALTQQILNAIKDEKIYSAEIVSLTKRKSVFEKINKSLKTKSLKLSDSMAMELSNCGKLEALKMLFVGDLSNMVYVGDGKNDIEPMQQAKVSYALGKKLEVLNSATFAITSHKQITDNLFNDVDLTKSSQERKEQVENSKHKIKGLFKPKKKKYSSKKDLKEINTYLKEENKTEENTLDKLL